MKFDELHRNQLTPESQIQGEDIAETESLRAMCSRARAYLASHEWCPPIQEGYLGFAVAGIIGVFLFRMERALQGQDDCLWVIEGDLPSAYLVTDKAPDGLAALRVYCGMMLDWVRAVRSKSDLGDIFPVEAKPTLKNAKELEDRIMFLQKEVLKD